MRLFRFLGFAMQVGPCGALLLLTISTAGAAQGATAPTGPAQVTLSDAGAAAAALPRLPPTIRQEVDRLAGDDPGSRATAALALGAMGKAAAPAIPWLFAAVSDRRDVRLLLTQEKTTVGEQAALALGKIGEPAFSQLRQAIIDASTDEVTWFRAAAVLALLRRAEVFDPLVARFRSLQPHVNEDDQASRRFVDVAWLLTCFPEPRVGDLLAEAIATGTAQRPMAYGLESLVDEPKIPEFPECKQALQDWKPSPCPALLEWWRSHRDQVKLTPFCQFPDRAR
jgi:hypothetical protein